MPALPPIGIAALRLRSQNTHVFEEFVGQVEDYYNTLSKELIMASSADILCAQGRAQSIGVLLRTLKECHLSRGPVQSTPSTGAKSSP